MKILIDIKDNKVSFVLELLNSLSFVKVNPLVDDKTQQIHDITESVEELKLMRQGKMKA